MRGKRITIPFSVHMQTLDQIHSIDIGIEKTQLLARESVYWINMNVYIEHVVKQCAICFKYQQMQPSEKALHYIVPCRPWEVVGADVFVINNKTHLCIVDYHSKFPIVKNVNSLSADNQMQTAKLIFAEYGLPK